MIWHIPYQNFEEEKANIVYQYNGVELLGRKWIEAALVQETNKGLYRIEISSSPSLKGPQSTRHSYDANRRIRERKQTICVYILLEVNIRGRRKLAWVLGSEKEQR